MEEGNIMAKAPKASNPRDVQPFIVDICGNISEYEVMLHSSQRKIQQQSFNYRSAVGPD